MKLKFSSKKNQYCRKLDENENKLKLQKLKKKSKLEKVKITPRGRGEHT